MNLSNFQDKSVTFKLVITAIFGAIAFLLNYVEIPFAVPYLRFEFSEVIVLLMVLLLGLRYGIMVTIIKTILFSLMGGNSEPIGLSVLLLSSMFLAILFYLMTRKLSLIPSLIITGIIFAIVLTLANYYFITPLYSKMSFTAMNTMEMELYGHKFSYFMFVVALYFPFNIIKMTLIGIVVTFLKTIFIKRYQS